MRGKPAKWLQRWFLFQVLVAIGIGAALWLVPGRALTLIGWAPETVQLPESDLSVPGVTFLNPTFVRLVGAALLAFAAACSWSWKADDSHEVRILTRFGLTFGALGVLAVLAGRFRSTEYFPWAGWGALAILLTLTVGWALVLFRENYLMRSGPESAGDSEAAEAGRAPVSYLLNLEETIAQLRRVVESLPDREAREQILNEVSALDAIARVAKLSAQEEPSGGALEVPGQDNS